LGFLAVPKASYGRTAGLFGSLRAIESRILALADMHPPEFLANKFSKCDSVF
jgi:hypothetical protein